MLPLTAASRDGRSEVIRLGIDDPAGSSIRLVRAGGEETVHAGVDLFECLQGVRRHLESEGLLVCCQGARPGVFPSGMSRQMSNGRYAYPLRRDPPLTDADLVDIFAPAEISEVGTVDDQRRAVAKFFGFPGGG
jgi:hypothetical protein